MPEVAARRTVYRVWDEELGRSVALKTLQTKLIGTDYATRFLEEVRATARLQHPGVIPVYDHGELPDGRPYFTMREVAGHTLGEVMRADRSAGRNTRSGVAA